MTASFVVSAAQCAEILSAAEFIADNVGDWLADIPDSERTVCEVRSFIVETVDPQPHPLVAEMLTELVCYRLTIPVDRRCPQCLGYLKN